MVELLLLLLELPVLLGGAAAEAAVAAGVAAFVAAGVAVSVAAGQLGPFWQGLQLLLWPGPSVSSSPSWHGSLCQLLMACSCYSCTRIGHPIYPNLPSPLDKGCFLNTPRLWVW